MNVYVNVLLGFYFFFFSKKSSFLDKLFGSTRQSRLSSEAALQQMRVGALSPMPSCLGIGGHPKWVPARTPTVHWGLNSRKAVGDPFGSDSRYTANMVAEQVVNVTERLVAEEWNKAPQETYNAKSRRVAWVDHVQRTRRGDRVRGNLKQGTFSKHDHHQTLV